MNAGANEAERLAVRRARRKLAWITVAVLLCLLAPAFFAFQSWSAGVRLVLSVGFAAAAAWRLFTMIAARSAPAVELLPDAALPAYTVIAPLYREAGMVDQLVGAISDIDYPGERLQVLLALEADDAETIAAARSRELPPGFEVVIVPPGRPKTKPRACNVALEQATGELLTIYDAEDRPDPQQLREAAARFAHGPADLGCLQAPLRISNSGRFFPAQFANEYAAQFELLLPTMARLGLPFPLGGTSNHFKIAVLRDVGGWDAYNVTEDADLGFRLARRGWRAGVLNAPTWENAPETLYDWLPQRSRWLKGYLQTLFGLMPEAGVRPRLWLGLLATLMLAISSAAVHLPAFVWLLVYSLFWIMGGPAPTMSAFELIALLGGWTAAAAAGALGAHRAGSPVRLRDALAAPLYWPLLTVAMLHALWRAIVEPHRWDKTDHRPWLAPA